MATAFEQVRPYTHLVHRPMCTAGVMTDGSCMTTWNRLGHDTLRMS